VVDIGEVLLVGDFGLRGERRFLVLREGGVVEIDLLVGVDEVLVVGVGIGHLRYQILSNSTGNAGKRKEGPSDMPINHPTRSGNNHKGIYQDHNLSGCAVIE
jgi:hypothetical protein